MRSSMTHGKPLKTIFTQAVTAVAVKTASWCARLPTSLSRTLQFLSRSAARDRQLLLILSAFVRVFPRCSFASPESKKRRMKSAKKRREQPREEKEGKKPREVDETENVTGNVRAVARLELRLSRNEGWRRMRIGMVPTEKGER
ncbi:hypothetical protein PUN28_018274 [Cardiocondyla obscurior]|uniref:Uncharacterized protein n=1 Tax=Cardiocondyla obscurior TaxID=286306 RepID=A0AAW2EIX5_9HYME